MSEVRLIDDWREKWEERTTHGRPIVAVADIGEKIEVWALASNLGMATYGEYYLIPKPQPKKLRPWKREEVPVDEWFRNKCNKRVYRIEAMTEEGTFKLIGGWYGPEAIFDDFVLHRTTESGEWKPVEQCRPCGVEE